MNVARRANMAEQNVEQSKSKADSDNSAVKGNSKRNVSKGKSSVSTKTDNASVESEIMQCLRQIQTSQSTYDQKVDGMMERLKKLEDTYQYEEDAYYDYENCDLESQEENLVQDVSGPSSPKKQKTDNSRFASMAKRFKGKEVCDTAVDSSLAENINDVFMNGMDEEHYNTMIKDENISRPENCEALVTVKCNKMIWDLCPTSTKFIDKKLQNSETSLIKGSILVTKVVNKLAQVESEATEKGLDLTNVIDQCNDALSLFGHANRQLNMSRREILKPELKSEFSHLCNPSVPYTKELFGDDLSKTAKEIEDSVKMSHRIQYGFQRPFTRGRVFRGRSRGRSYSVAPYRPRGAYGTNHAYSGADPKNQGRRGGQRGALRH